MQHTKSLKEFALCNDAELRKIVASICDKQHVSPHYVDDVVQDVYMRMIRSSILDRFDPNFGGFSTKISTYLYPMIYRMVIGLKKKGQYKIEAGRYRATDSYKEQTGETDDVEIALRCCGITPEFQSILEHNASEEGLGADLHEFEEKWLGKTYRNRKFSLSRRKDKTVGKNGCTLLEVYRYINLGLNNRQIGEIFGVSAAFISSLKRIIARSLRAYGISCGKNFHQENWVDAFDDNPTDNAIIKTKPCKPAPQAAVKPIGKNGHKHEFKRPINESERQKLKAWWLARSGIVGWDDVRDYRKDHIHQEVSIMQVCGFISSLHQALARGELEIVDRAGYNANRISRGQSTIPLIVAQNG